MPVTAAIISTAAARMSAAVTYNSQAAETTSAELLEEPIAETVTLLGAECHMLGFVLDDTRRRFTKPISTQVQALPQALLDAISQVLVACEMTTSVATRTIEQLQAGLEEEESPEHHQGIMTRTTQNIHGQASMLSLLIRTIDRCVRGNTWHTPTHAPHAGPVIDTSASPTPNYILAVLKSNKSELESLKFEAAAIQAELARETMSHTSMMPPPLQLPGSALSVPQSPPMAPQSPPMVPLSPRTTSRSPPILPQSPPIVFQSPPIAPHSPPTAFRSPSIAPYSPPTVFLSPSIAPQQAPTPPHSAADVMRPPPSVPIPRRPAPPVHSSSTQNFGTSDTTLSTYYGSYSESGSYSRHLSMASEADTDKEVMFEDVNEKEVVPVEKEVILDASSEDHRSYRARYPQASALDLKAIQKKTMVPLIGISAVYPNDTQVQACGPQGVKYSEVSLSNRDLNLAGMSHTITMTLMAVFVSRGMFTWDQTIVQALPSVASSMNRSHIGTTIGMLGAHASGLTQNLDTLKDPGMWSILKDPKTTSQQARLSIASSYLSQPAPTTPGTESVPRHVNGMIIALILEETTGKPFDRLIKTELFKPLDMVSATLGVKIHSDPGAVWLRQAESGHAIGYTKPKPENGGSSQFSSTFGGLPYVAPGAIAALYPSTGMACTLGDLAKFLQLHADGAAGNKTAILGHADFKDLHRKVPGLLSTFGGWFEQDPDAKHSWVSVRRLFSHSKGAGFTVRCELAPDAHAAFACIVNGSGSEAATAASAGLDLCFEELAPKSPASGSSTKGRAMFKSVRRWSKTSISS